MAEAEARTADEIGIDSVEDLFAARGREMIRRARRVLGSEADAEDAVQEAMLVLLRAPHALAAVERLGSWLYTVVRRRCVDIVRADVRRRETEAASRLEDLFDADDPFALMERAEVAEEVARAIDALSADLRQAFVENALEGRTFREISEETGVPMGTLMARKKKAADSIRERLRRAGLAGGDRRGDPPEKGDVRP